MISKWVKARKDHKCSYCGDTIKKGSLYHYLEFREPRYTEDVIGNDVQVGIWYIKNRSCEKCELELLGL